ncbi:hypothetical protein [Teredinibacter turnerae]|uniref:hypothetical protein n=2 Tax=Teredinibacter turnerae TaxID=2426 RepID=UPI00035DAD8F|nr:hypothetical protein [Teredinibacter turnerae]
MMVLSENNREFEDLKMDFDAWNVDLDTLSAYHTTGFRISVEGSPTHPLGVSPSHFPAGLSAVEQARLIRCGMKAIKDAATGTRASKTSDDVFDEAAS